MNEADKIRMVKLLVGDPSLDDETVRAYLSLAEAKILSRMYPFNDGAELVLPKRYDQLHIELTSRYILRRGVEGQVSSAENGVTRGYGSENDEDLLKEVVQVVRI